MSDATLRGRRDEWITAGVFDRLAEEALEAYDRIIGLDLSSAPSTAGSTRPPPAAKAPVPAPLTGANSAGRWSLFADRNGIPVGWAIDGANRHDTVLLEPTCSRVTERALICDAETLHLDRATTTTWCVASR